MKRCAFLSMDSLANFVCYDHLLMGPFRDIGWQAEEVSWKNELIDWSQYDRVIIRSTWDYQEDSEKFIGVLQKIDQHTHLQNALTLVRWNLNKKYLEDIKNNGFEIVPTIWGTSLKKGDLADYFKFYLTDKIIIKPAVSANADDTFLLNRVHTEENKLIHLFSNRQFMVQPFMPNIITEGEYSLFYFAGEYSHCIIKKPKSNDFRVQEEHGGILNSLIPHEIIKSKADAIIASLKPQPLYARADLVRTPQNTFALMELELIEPSLYFNMDKDSPQRFVKAFLKSTK